MSPEIAKYLLVAKLPTAENQFWRHDGFLLSDFYLPPFSNLVVRLKPEPRMN